MTGISEHWNVGKDDKKGGRDGFEPLKPNIPLFHYSIIPEGLGCIDHYQQFGLFVTDITKFVCKA